MSRSYRYLIVAASVFLATAARGADEKPKPVKPAEKRPNRILTAEEQREYFVVPEGFRVELVASDPLVINPITMTVDEKGRIYVSESHTYRYGPKGSPVKPFANPIVRLDPAPDGKGLVRVPVADGFEEPVMGLAVRDGKLWCTADNFLYVFDLAPDGRASNRRTLVIDKNKAWNPFGMFVIEFGPDGRLYMSVGNHNILLTGPDGTLSGRGSSGIVTRMNPDGGAMERLVHGLRVPYSFEFDPFGQLWLLSNGEGNPNRFVRVIEGVDYHCYSRSAADGNWLSGNHPLAPPCFTLPSGANTQLMRYYGSAYPASYRGSLLLDNWGAHGFNGANRAVLRYHPDDRGNIASKEVFVTCTDPHFRPSHIALDPDGNLLVADWYGRDDESDVTGRIWRVRYVGTEKIEPATEPDWTVEASVVTALGSPHHLIREKATAALISKGNAVVAALGEHAAKGPSPLGSANALWVLIRIATPEAHAQVSAGARHADWHVRRLAINLLRRYKLPAAGETAQALRSDPDAAVRVEAARANTEPAEVRAALFDALQHGAAKDVHLRYEAAWHLARLGDAASFDRLAGSTDADVRLAGQLAIDIACWENFPSKADAIKSLAKLLENPNEIDVANLLTLYRLNAEKEAGPTAAIEKLLSRPELPPVITAQALLAIRDQVPGKGIADEARRRFLTALEKGAIKLASTSDQLLLVRLLEAEGPTPFVLKQLAGLLGSPAAVRTAAAETARRFGPKAAELAGAVRRRLGDRNVKSDERLELMGTLVRIETAPDAAAWEALLSDPDAAVRTEAVRWWRAFKGRPGMTETLAKHAPELVKLEPAVKDDLSQVLRELGAEAAEPDSDKAVLTEKTLLEYSTLTPAAKARSVAAGRTVFERNACVQCHVGVVANTPLAPALKGLASAQKAEYMVESILFPSKIIKTGYESEAVLTKDGEIHTGLVREEGGLLVVRDGRKETRIAKADVDKRSTQKISIMPEGQEKLLSRRELVDLVSYLMSLK